MKQEEMEDQEMELLLCALYSTSGILASFTPSAEEEEVMPLSDSAKQILQTARMQLDANSDIIAQTLARHRHLPLFDLLQALTEGKTEVAHGKTR